jgi:hypothetical protein
VLHPIAIKLLNANVDTEFDVQDFPFVVFRLLPGSAPRRGQRTVNGKKRESTPAPTGISSAPYNNGLRQTNW